MKFSAAGQHIPAPEVLEERTPHAVVRYPDSFAASAYDGAELVLTLRGEQAGFRPNLVLTAVESSAPLTDATAVALLAAGTQHPGARLVGVDLWDEDPDAILARARRITFVYPAGATDVIVTKTVWATGTHHVHLSASATPAQLGTLTPTFLWIAAQLRLTADPADVEAAARGTGAASLDAAASGRVGFPLEDLAPFAPAPFDTTAPAVSVEALTELRAGASRSRLGAPLGALARRVRGTDAAAELAAAGLVDDTARLTPTGVAVSRALGATAPVLVVRVRRGGHAAVLVAFAGPQGIAVSHDPSIAELRTGAVSADPERRHLALVVPEHLPALVAAWVGLEPFWPIQDDTTTVTAEDLENHVRADEGTWTDVLVQGAGVERYDVIVPGKGWRRVAPAVDGLHGLTADPSLAVFSFLVEACARSLEEVPISPSR